MCNNSLWATSGTERELINNQAEPDSYRVNNVKFRRTSPIARACCVATDVTLILVAMLPCFVHSDVQTTNTCSSRASLLQAQMCCED